MADDKGLSKNECAALKELFGIQINQDSSAEEIAASFDKTIQKIKDIERKVFSKIRIETNQDLEQKDNEPTCSFCGKTTSKTVHLVHKIDSDISICNKCIHAFYQLLDAE